MLEKDKKNQVIYCAYTSTLSSNLSLSTTTLIRNNKKCYTLDNISQILISRNLSKNLKSILDKQKNRNKISRQLSQHLKEGTSYRIYRLDIKSFFESINHTTIKSALEKSKASNQTNIAINSIIKNLSKTSEIGLPRGLEFSPLLSEIILKNFDKEIKNNEHVFCYCRYVDDIIIITTGFENKKSFLKMVKKQLPKELSLNYNKQKIISVPSRVKNKKEVANFDYLGYNYSVIDTETKANKNVFRRVQISLSNSRIKKIKTRISRSIYMFSKDGDFETLKNRLEFLTTNRLIKDKKSERKIATGIYYNNPNLTEGNQSLLELDSFLKKSVLGYSSKRGTNYTYNLAPSQKRILMKLSFNSGYNNNNYKRFSPNTLSKIKDAWRY